MAPFVLSTTCSQSVLTDIRPGAGWRQIGDAWDDYGKDATHVAITWASINAPLLKSMQPGNKANHPSLFRATQDLYVSTSTAGVMKEGPSGGASIALGLVCRLLQYPSPGRGHYIGVSAQVDLRGRLLPVGDLDKKAVVAQKAALRLVVVCKENFDGLVAEGFTDIPEGEPRDYAMANFRSAETMLDVIGITLQGGRWLYHNVCCMHATP